MNEEQLDPKQEQEQTQAPDRPIDPEESATPEKPKSNNRNLIILIISVIFVAVVCLFAYFFFTKQWIFSEKDQTTAAQQFTTEDYPKWDGSTATQPLLLAFYKDFTGNSEAKLSDFSLTKTHQAIMKVANKEIDLAITTHPSQDEIAEAEAVGTELQITPITNEGFVFFVSNDNPIDNLSVAQIQNIYQGKIVNWSQAGGDNLSIIPYQRPKNSGSQTGMQELVMKDKTLMKPTTEDIVIDTMASIIDLVSNYKSSPSAIGYSYYYYASTMYQSIDKNTADGIKLLSIDGIRPEDATIANKTYPFTTSYYIITRKNDTNEQTQKLIDLMLSSRGQNVARKASYVPIQ